MCGYVRTPPPQKNMSNDAITLKSLRTIDSGQKRFLVNVHPIPKIVNINASSSFFKRRTLVGSRYAHLVHTALILVWAGTMSLFELSHFIPEKPLYEQGFILLPHLFELGGNLYSHFIISILHLSRYPSSWRYLSCYSWC